MRTIFFLLCVLLCRWLPAQDLEWAFFNLSPTLKPQLSEIRNPLIKTEVGFINKLDNSYFVDEFTHRPFVESNLGFRLPLISLKDHRKSVKWVSSGVLGNNVLVDLFGPPTAAVINTDYFFGFRTGGIKYFDHPLVRNAGIMVVPYFHESAHLGDEFSLHGYQTVPGFKRINISYETWEVAAVINDPDTLIGNLISLTAGVQGLWKPNEGYYFTDSLEVQGAYVPDCENRFEFYARLNLQRTSGLFCSPRWINILSAEVRNRAKLSYDPSIPETRAWNYNVYFGWMLQTNNHKNPGLFLRYYSGIIPHGQFRNTGQFRFIGVSLVYY